MSNFLEDLFKGYEESKQSEPTEEFNWGDNDVPVGKEIL